MNRVPLSVDRAETANTGALAYGLANKPLPLTARASYARTYRR
jgi:hypothetical protein